MKLSILASVVFSCAVFTSTSVFAHELEAEMKTLAKSTQAFAKTEDLEKAKKQLAMMRTAAVASKQSLPHQLEGKSPEDEQVKAYQAGLDDLVLEIDRVSALVEQGQLSQAKQEALNLVKIRNENHKKFK